MTKEFNYFKKNNLTICLGIVLSSFFITTNVHSEFFPVNPIYPDQSTNTGAGRFGEGRGNAKFGTYGHQGVDISAPKNTPLYAVADSTVIASVTTGSGGGIGTVLQPKNSDVVAVYWHQNSIARKALGVGNEVKAKDVIGYSGNTQVPQLDQSKINSTLAYHLHFGVGVLKKEQAVDAWLNNSPRSGSEVVNSISLSNSQKGKTPLYGKKSYYWTNPAPFLPRDTIIRVSGKLTGGVDPLIPFIGNSIRSQYNALTGANLPLGSGAIAGRRASEIPKLRVTAHGVPNGIASEMGQAALVGVIASGNADDLLGQNTVSMEELAYYAPPRTIFGGDTNVEIDIGDGDVTKIELIDKIGSSRFGNDEWQGQLLGMSMRGMLIEYLNALNAKNFLKKELLLQKERIESLYAAWTATVAKLNVQGDLQESLEKAQNPEIIPEMSRLSVEQLYERVEMGLPPNSTDVARAITINKTGQFKTCDASYVRAFEQLPMGVKKELIAIALRQGFHPVDYLTMVGVETSFNAQNNLYRPAYVATTEKGTKVTRYPAAGFIQLTPGGAGDIPYGKLISLFPQAKPVLTEALGGSSDSAMRYGAQQIAHGPYLKKLQNINPRLEFAVYDAYFYAKHKSFYAVPASEKNLPRLYRMIIGGPYYKNSDKASIRKGYAQNAQYDVDGNDIFTAEEAVLYHPMFKSRRCQYVTDEQILSNAYGLTNEDLKLIPWDKSIERVNSPTLNNLGGYFSFSVGFKAKENIQ